MVYASRVLAAPRYRHFFPASKELTFSVKTGAGAAPNPIQTFNADGQIQKALPADTLGLSHRTTSGLWLEVGGLPITNTYSIVEYTLGRPVWGWSFFEYDPVSNSIVFVREIPVGTELKVFERIAQPDGFRTLVVPQYLLLQGVAEFPRPTRASGEPTFEVVRTPIVGVENPREILGLPMEGPDGRFMGAFNCELEILSACAKGTVRPGADATSFEYKPPSGYVGRDSFSYRLVTPFGQQSDAACVQLVVHA